jgi:uncharacterized membrane protein
MTPSLLSSLSLLSILGAATIGGVFSAFSTFVMRALRRLPAAQGMAAMQSINIAVINPVFLGVFMGTGAVCIMLALVSWFGPHAGAPARTFAAAVYLLGSVGVTMAFNVPLNNRLARLDAAAPESAELWPRYVAAWTRWNHVRTVASVAAAGVLLLCGFSYSPRADASSPRARVREGSIAVLVAKDATPGEGSKYWWQRATVVEVVSGTVSRDEIGPTVEFAHLNTVPDVPAGRVMLKLRESNGYWYLENVASAPAR